MSYKIHIYNHLVTNIVVAKSMFSCIVPCALEMSQCHTPYKVSMWALFGQPLRMSLASIIART